MYFDIDALMEGVSYPADCREVLETCGDRTVELQTGEETVAEVLERCRTDELQTPQDARETLLSALGDGAIGRKYYSDRDPPIPGAQGPEPLSL